MKIHIFCIALLIAMLGVQTVSGWQDHFTSDTSGDYGPDAASFTWNTALGTGYLNATAGNNKAVYYDTEFGTGSYQWDYVKDPRGDTWWEYGYHIWASDTKDTGNPLNQGTKYVVRTMMKNCGGANLYKVVSGALTDIGGGQVNMEPFCASTYNITVYWDKSTGDILVYSNDALLFDVTDTDITDDGYMGVSYYTDNDPTTAFASWDYISLDAPTTPTPTPTTTPAPTLTWQVQELDSGLYLSGEKVEPGIITSIYLVLDQNPFLLVAVLALALIFLTTPRR